MYILTVGGSFLFELYGIAWGLSLGGTAFFPVEEKKRYSEPPRPDLLHPDLSLEELAQKYHETDVVDDVKKVRAKKNFIYERGEIIKIKKDDHQKTDRVFKKKSVIIPKKINLKDFVFEPGQEISPLADITTGFIPLGSDLQNPYLIAKLQQEKSSEDRKATSVQRKTKDFVFATDMAVEAIEDDEPDRFRRRLEIELVKNKIQFISFHKQKNEFIIWFDSLPDSLQEQTSSLPLESIPVSFLDGSSVSATLVRSTSDFFDEQDDSSVMIYINPSRLVFLPTGTIAADQQNRILFHLKKNLQRKEILDHVLDKIKQKKSYAVSIKLLEGFYQEIFTVLNGQQVEPQIQFLNNENIDNPLLYYESIKNNIFHFRSEIIQDHAPVDDSSLNESLEAVSVNPKPAFDYATEKLLQELEVLSYQADTQQVQKTLKSTIDDLFYDINQVYNPTKKIPKQLDLRARKDLEIDPYAPQDLRARKELEIDPYAPQDLRARKELEIDPYAPQDLRARKELEIDPYAPQDLRARKELEIHSSKSEDLQPNKDFVEFTTNKDFKSLKNESHERKLNDIDSLENSFTFLNLDKQAKLPLENVFEASVKLQSEPDSSFKQANVFSTSQSSLAESELFLAKDSKAYIDTRLPSLDFLRAELQTNTLKITQELIKNIDKTLIASLLIQNYKHIAATMANPPVINIKNGLDNLVSAVKDSNTHSQI